MATDNIHNSREWQHARLTIVDESESLLAAVQRVGVAAEYPFGATVYCTTECLSRCVVEGHAVRGAQRVLDHVALTHDPRQAEIAWRDQHAARERGGRWRCGGRRGQHELQERVVETIRHGALPIGQRVERIKLVAADQKRGGGAPLFITTCVPVVLSLHALQSVL